MDDTQEAEASQENKTDVFLKRSQDNSKPVLMVGGFSSLLRNILLKLLERWEIVIYDSREELFTEDDYKHFTVVIGDPSSKVVLRKVKREPVEAAFATLRDDETNLEFCLLCRSEFHVDNLISLVEDPANLDRFLEHNIKTIDLTEVLAGAVESHFNRGRRRATGVGLEIGEILEVEVPSHSPVIGKQLMTLRPQSWLLGAIYRDNDLVVPHGRTVIQKGDKCLLIGKPNILPFIAEYFQRGSSEFPLQYGTRIGVLYHPDMNNYDEAQYLVSSTEAVGLRILVEDKAFTERAVELGDSIGLKEDQIVPIEQEYSTWPSADSYARLQDATDLGILVTHQPEEGWLQQFSRENRNFWKLLDSTLDPVLVGRGTAPYKNILLPIGVGSAFRRVVEVAIDIARKLGANLSAVGFASPDFVTGESYRETLEESAREVKNIAAVYSLEIHVEILDGHPVWQTVELLQKYDLAIVGHSGGGGFSLLPEPDISKNLILRSPCSLLVVPTSEEGSVAS